ncbi:MAG: hypothetical protein IPG17_22900 [Sandaracinaceae bacterium]|jgi:hypothetical protein|nr:hypothetical protein [Sandaracinaceae bacterium]MBP7680291.1 hypothetical protein [Deltaproteobacteria bacterium]MBK6807908.1 hypothetical protein [Sandaracinaceae bacterium]MBK7154925.1 hypothetical protein [Sandaracinaceae bacterium]MBK7772936.1 hypothetical protein [Sandaracinaceae bacterium]
MNPKLLHRVVALLLFLFALTHGLGMLSDSGHGFVMDLVVFGMESAPVERLGVQRTMMDFHVGYGALFVVYLLFGSALSLELAGVSGEHPRTATRMALAHGVALGFVFLICLRYFFVAPTLLALLSAAGTLWAAFLTSRRGGD